MRRCTRTSGPGSFTAPRIQKQRLDASDLLGQYGFRETAMNGKQGVLNRFFLAAVLGIAVSSISPVLLAADAAAQQPAAVREDWYPKIADFEFMSQHVEIPRART